MPSLDVIKTSSDEIQSFDDVEMHFPQHPAADHVHIVAYIPGGELGLIFYKTGGGTKYMPISISVRLTNPQPFRPPR